jgi:hypothetical protein
MKMRVREGKKMWVTLNIVTLLSLLAALGCVACVARKLDARLAAMLEEQGKSRRSIELELAGARAALDALKSR